MFTGIVSGQSQVRVVEKTRSCTRLVVELAEFEQGLSTGQSVSINGVCLTVSRFASGLAEFDLITTTLDTTNLGELREGQSVNVERSIKFGDEIGGHLLSGHVACVVRVVQCNRQDETASFCFVVPIEWRQHLHTKGFVALNGVSLTLAEYCYDSGMGWVHLIPETVRRTNLGQITVESLLNLEVDTQTQTIVNTVERILANRTK